MTCTPRVNHDRVVVNRTRLQETPTTTQCSPSFPSSLSLPPTSQIPSQSLTYSAIQPPIHPLIPSPTNTTSHLLNHPTPSPKSTSHPHTHAQPVTSTTSQTPTHTPSQPVTSVLHPSTHPASQPVSPKITLHVMSPNKSSSPLSSFLFLIPGSPVLSPCRPWASLVNHALRTAGKKPRV